MPSAVHQWLVVWLSRRILRDGYSVLGADAGAFASRLLPRPAPSIAIGPIRPDVIGIVKRKRLLAVGEAKSANDLANDHTLVQLAAMLCMRDAHGRLARVYLAFPSSSLATAARMLLSLGLENALRVTLVPIPDVLLEGVSK